MGTGKVASAVLYDPSTNLPNKKRWPRCSKSEFAIPNAGASAIPCFAESKPAQRIEDQVESFATGSGTYL